jgi:hypothetical protein
MKGEGKRWREREEKKGREGKRVGKRKRAWKIVKREK